MTSLIACLLLVFLHSARASAEDTPDSGLGFFFTTYPAEKCAVHAATNQPCKTYIEFYNRPLGGSKATLLSALTYTQFLGLFEPGVKKPAAVKQDKPALWKRILRGVGVAAVDVVKLLVPGASTTIDLAKIVADAATKVASPAAESKPLGEGMTPANSSIAD